MRKNCIGIREWLALGMLAIVVGFGLACMESGGGGDGVTGEIEGLTLPDRIQMTQLEGSEGRALRSLSRALYNDPGTDYSNAPKQSWSEDTDALDMANSILSATKDTCYESFVNAGPYKALVRKVDEEKQSQSGSSGSSTATEELQEIILDVTRASNDDPMYVKIWVEEPQGPGGTPMLIRGYFEVTEGVSDQYPYGKMEAHMKGNILNPDGSEGNQVMTMALKIDADDNGNPIVQFINSGSEPGEGYQWEDKVRVLGSDTELIQGKAYVYEAENEPWEGHPELIPHTYYYAFNEDYFKYSKDGQETVLDKNSLHYNVCRYQLFDATTGELITMNSGFPIQFPEGTGHGYIGYYGLWAPYGTTVNDGVTVTRPDTGDQYTLVKKGGKLLKYIKHTVKLGDLANVEMYYWQGEPGTPAKDYIVIWDGDNFKKIGERDPFTGNITYYEESDQTIVIFNEWESVWCESLRACIHVGSLQAPVTDDSDVSYHVEETVIPGDAPTVPLYYWGFALDLPITLADIQGAWEAESAYWPNPTEKTYIYDAIDIVLEDEATDSPVLLEGVSASDLSGTRYEGGYNLVPLTIDHYTIDNFWQANDAEVYYFWITGPNEWNQFATVKIDNTYVEFDEPLTFIYTHLTTNDLNNDDTHDGQTFRIDYDGFSLGMPWGFNEATGEWEPLINLKDGTPLSNPTGDYVVKGIEEGVRMQPAADPSAAADLVVDTTIEAPDLTYDSTQTDLVGAIPTDVELEVIKGELIE